jgi:hypothetical protein
MLASAEATKRCLAGLTAHWQLVVMRGRTGVHTRLEAVSSALMPFLAGNNERGISDGP